MGQGGPRLPHATDLPCSAQPARLTFAELEPVLRRTAAVAARTFPAADDGRVRVRPPAVIVARGRRGATEPSC